jgi:hypothetical protein
MPETANGIGPVKSFGSVAEYGRTAEQMPVDTPSQFTGMIESDDPFKDHTTVSPLEIVTTGGEKDPSAFTLTVTVAADMHKDIAKAAMATMRIRDFIVILSNSG